MSMRGRLQSREADAPTDPSKSALDACLLLTRVVGETLPTATATVAEVQTASVGLAFLPREMMMVEPVYPALSELYNSLFHLKESELECF